jgi:hypothetical protein
VPIFSKIQKEHSKLDMAKCFTWQKGNNIGLYKLEDSLQKSHQSNKSYGSSMLSFENSDFASRYSYKDTLDYAYFIKQGRPFFAYHYFVQNLIKKYGKMNKTL